MAIEWHSEWHNENNNDIGITSFQSQNGNSRNIFMLTIKRFETVADERDTEEFVNWPTHAHIFESLREKPNVEVLIVAQENDNTPGRHFHVLLRMPETVCLFFLQVLKFLFYFGV